MLPQPVPHRTRAHRQVRTVKCACVVPEDPLLALETVTHLLITSVDQFRSCRMSLYT